MGSRSSSFLPSGWLFAGIAFHVLLGERVAVVGGQIGAEPVQVRLEQLLAVTCGGFAEVGQGLDYGGAAGQVEDLVFYRSVIVLDLRFLGVARGEQTLPGGIFECLATVVCGDRPEHQAGKQHRQGRQQYRSDRDLLVQSHAAFLHAGSRCMPGGVVPDPGMANEIAIGYPVPFLSQWVELS